MELARYRTVRSVTKICAYFVSAGFIYAGLGFLLQQDLQAASSNKLTRGAFLVSTKQLNNSSFQETVILITHYSERGATGIAINRESSFKIKDVFPNSQVMQKFTDTLFLGGPVRPEAIFVLISSKHAVADMQEIAPGLYFSAGAKAVAHGFARANEHIRAYAGYSGWAPGQLENEISRGDWLVIDAKPDIIFTEDYDGLWKRLFTTWSGRWI